MNVVAVLTGCSVAVAIVVGLPTRRLPPDRLVTLFPDCPNRCHRTGWLNYSDPFTYFGRWLRVRIARLSHHRDDGSCGEAVNPAADRRIGATATAVICFAFVQPVVALGLLAAALILPIIKKRRDARMRQEMVREQLPDVVDLLRLAVGSGMTVHLAIDAVSVRCDGVVGERLREVRRRILLGQRLHEALDALVDLGDPAIGLTRALIASESDGAPLAPSLDQVAAEARLHRRRAAEEAARRLPVKLLFPLVACILPAFLLLTVVPLLGGALGSLGL